MEKRIADKQKLEKLVTLIVEKLLDIVDKNQISEDKVREILTNVYEIVHKHLNY
jgi:hypothetical protein